MLNGWDILRLRLRYGHLGTEEFLDLLQSTLRELGKASHTKLHRLILEIGFAIRPTIGGRNACPPDDMRWKYWVSMAMRYFPALAQEGGERIRPNTISNVRDWIEHDRVLMQALLFGDRKLVVDTVLRDDANSSAWRALLSEPSPEQATILDIICYHVRSKNITERQVGNWSTELHEEWASALQGYLQVRLLVGLTQLTERIVTRLAGAETPADPAMFKQHMERFREVGLGWAYGQALGYHNELRRRYRQAGRSAVWVPIDGIGVAVSMLSMFIARLLNAHPAIQLSTILGVILFLALVAFHLLRVVIVLVSASGSLEAQLQTLSEIEALYLSERDL
jgi:hypothetical protein